jgi:hypothetical protein
MNQAWARAESDLYAEVPVPGRVIKLKVGEHDIYAKIAYSEGRPVYVDISLAFADRRRPTCVAETEAITAGVTNARAQLEVICRQASALLQANVWSQDDLVRAWRATQFDPAGLCPQVEGIVSSPLDAVARYLEKRGAS